MKLVWLFLALIGSARAVEVLPPVPAQYFNDYAHAVAPATAAELNRQLEDFERATSSQILVAVFPKMESDSSIEDYTVRVAQSWRVGQKGKDNGAVLFVFVQDRKMYLQVGYGLEGALPDAIAKRIIEKEIKPRFREGNIDAGLRAGVNAILQATRGEYQGTGRKQVREVWKEGWFWLFLVVAFFIVMACFIGGSTTYTSGGRTYRRRSSWVTYGGGFGGGGSSGGGFSGGGGSFGGGGAGGSW